MPSPSVSTFTFPSTTDPVFTASTSEPVFESPNHSQTSTKHPQSRDLEVAITLKTKGGLDYLSFDDLYNKLRTLEIDVKGGSSYDSRGTSAPTHSAFISVASTNSKMSYPEQSHATTFTSASSSPAASSNVIEHVLHSFVAESNQQQQITYEDFDQIEKMDLEELDIKWQMAMLSVRINRFEKKAGRKIKLITRMLQGGFKSKVLFIQTSGADKTEELKALLSVDSMLNCQIMKGEDVKMVMLKYLLLRFNLRRLRQGLTNGRTLSKTGQTDHSSMSSKIKFGLGFGETFGSDEVFDPSGPSIFDTTPEDVAEKPLYDRFVKAVGMHAVPPPITGHFMPPSNNPDLDDTQFTYGSKSNNYFETNSISNDFVSCDNSDKSSDSETTDFASCVSSVKTSSSKTNEPLASAPSSVEFKPLSKTDVQQSNSTNDDSSFSFKENVKPPRNLCNKSGINRRGIWGTAVKPSAGCSWQIQRPNMQWVSKNNGGSHQYTWFKKLLNDPQVGPSQHDRKIRRKLDDFVKIIGELQNFNLFSVSQICDTKNKVLFTDTECLVLSKEFQLPENSQVVLRVPRRNNLYCFNLSDIKPERDVTCLLAKASLAESTKWHRRMAHVNFKNINKLAKHGLVNGLPSKLFINEHNCVACNKGKQHKASYKAITALNKKVKAIRCDNGTEFKNSKLIELCGSKGIKRDYSNARTPQQNGVAERKNRTLIEAARTMLADSKLPTMFWTEAVSTACYVLNRVLVTSPHNKTPYELLSGKVPNISHLKPFGCHVTILNTSDHLGKFEGKADEGFIVGYAAHSKAYRVYNLSSKKIEETLNLRYLEDKPNVQGLGHEWYFDLDYLTDTLGYTRFKTNQPAGTQDTHIHAGTQDDSDSECDEQVIVVPSFPSTRFPGPKIHEASKMVESNSDYAEELARLQRQEHEANDTAEKYGFGFSKDTEEHLRQADIEARRNMVSAGSIVPAGSIDPAASISAGPAEPFPTVIEPVHADETSLPPGHSLGSSENSTRFPSPSDLANSLSSSSDMEDIYHHTSTGIFSSSSYDDDFGGTVTNLAPIVAVDPVPTKRTRGKLKKSKFGESTFVSYVHDQQRNNHIDYLHCLFACFLSQLEPSSVAQALNDPDWVEAMQEEMQQFINQKVWKLVPLPDGKIAIGTKWILKNKRDARGIVVRNKARLVAQGHTQEEGIDYDEVFALVARIEAIRLFLAFASYMGFMVYQMDVKSAFLYGEIDEEVYVTQPKGFEDPHFPKHVYKVVKALYGLHQAPRAWYARLSTFLLKHNYRRGTIDKTLFIKKNSRDIILVQVYVDDIIFGSTKKAWCDEFEVLMKGEFEMSAMGELTFFLGLQVKQKPDGIFISQDKYVQDMLKKFDMESVRTATTPYEASKPKSKDEPDDAVNVHLYRSMIGSLMYLTALRSDIMFAVSTCSRHQVTPLTSNLNAVKKIFKYLKGQPKLGLWYPRDSPFMLEAYSDSDYAGSNGDRKSTTGGYQFLGKRLISWQCKKQTIMATSSTEAEYVAAANCCGQVLWIQNQMLDYGFNFMNTKIFIDNQSTICIVKNPVFHQRTKHIEIRHHFIRDANEKNLIQVLKIHTDENVADLLTKAFDGPRFNYLVVHIGMLNP
ncbi:putative ribonuclease H-like domain-containing protein [Tanacetum coccineum]